MPNYIDNINVVESWITSPSMIVETFSVKVETMTSGVVEASESWRV